MINLQEKIEKTLIDDPYDFAAESVNGIPLFYKHFPSAPCMHIRIVFRFGAKHDPVGKEGVAHLVEHMIFKGTDIFDTEKDMENFRKNMTLGTLNAQTAIFEMVLTANCLPYNLEKTLEGLMSMVLTPKFRDEDFKTEKKIVMDEAWRRFKNEKQVAYIRKIRNARLSNLPDRLRIVSALGWPETISKIENTDVKDMYKKYMVKENISFFMAGNFDLVGKVDGVKKLLETYISKLPSGSVADFPYIPGEISLPTTQVFDTSYKDAGMSEKKQSSINISCSFPREKKENGALLSDSESLRIAHLILACKLIDDIIYEKLRMDKGWCYSAGASFGIDPEFLKLSLGAELNPEHTEEALQICKDVIDEIKKGMYGERFDQIKTLAIESPLAAERLTGDVISNVVDDFITENHLFTLKSVLHSYNNVKFEDVVSFLNEYIKPERLFTEILRPTPEDKKRFGFVSKIKNLFRK